MTTCARSRAISPPSTCLKRRRRRRRAAPTRSRAAPPGCARATRRTAPRPVCSAYCYTGALPSIPGLLGPPRGYLVEQFGAWRTGTRKALAAAIAWPRSPHRLTPARHHRRARPRGLPSQPVATGPAGARPSRPARPLPPSPAGARRNERLRLIGCGARTTSAQHGGVSMSMVRFTWPRVIAIAWCCCDRGRRPRWSPGSNVRRRVDPLVGDAGPSDRDARTGRARRLPGARRQLRGMPHRPRRRGLRRRQG